MAIYRRKIGRVELRLCTVWYSTKGTNISRTGNKKPDEREARNTWKMFYVTFSSKFTLTKTNLEDGLGLVEKVFF